jgi:hypothetical protein
VDLSGNLQAAVSVHLVGQQHHAGQQVLGGMAACDKAG